MIRVTETSWVCVQPFPLNPVKKDSGHEILLSSCPFVFSLFCALTPSLLPYPTAPSPCGMLLLTSHISPQGKESTRQDDRCWGKSPAPKISHSQELMFPKCKQSCMCVWTGDISSDLVGIVSCLLCPLEWISRCVQSTVALGIETHGLKPHSTHGLGQNLPKICCRSARCQVPSASRQLDSRHRAA